MKGYARLRASSALILIYATLGCIRAAFATDHSPLPALAQGFVTFGSFNNPAKVTSQVVEVWAQILHRLPQSRLVLKHKGMSDASIADALAKEFASQGIEPGRIECLGWSPHGLLQ